MTPPDLFLYILATLGGIGVSCVGSFSLLIGLCWAADYRRSSRSREIRERLDAELAAVGEEP